MNMFNAILWLPMRIGLATWAWLWGWTYPLAQPSITEMRASVRLDRFNPRTIIDALRFSFELPFMARAQHYAERSTPTRTSVPVESIKDQATLTADLIRWQAEPAWRSMLREGMVWATAASWLVTWGSIGASFASTGNFLFETHATPEAPGYVTTYFKVAALAMVLPVGWITAGITALGLTRRTN